MTDRTSYLVDGRSKIRRPVHATRLNSLILLVGDAAVLILFAALGRGQHHETSGLGEILYTASPFIVGWLVAGIARGAFQFRPAATPRQVVTSTSLTWLWALPLGLALRAVVQHRAIPISFDLVALLVNTCFLVAWRSAAQALLRTLSSSKPS
jgi:hypothetical protein